MKLILITLLFSLSHCGYNWGHSTRELPGGHKTVYVEMFENQTKEVGVEASFTEQLTHELERSGFAIVTSKNTAEVILKGTIINTTHVGSGSNSSFTSKDFSNSTSTNYAASFFTVFSLRITANLKAIRSRDKQMIWQTTLNGSRTYRGAKLKKQGVRSSNVLYNQSRKKQTIKLIAKDMMNEAFDRLTENF